MKLKDKVLLRGIDRNYELEAYSTGILEFRVGDLKARWEFVAADISDQVVLGIDFLEHYRAVINLSKFNHRGQN